MHLNNSYHFKNKTIFNSISFKPIESVDNKLDQIVDAKLFFEIKNIIRAKFPFLLIIQECYKYNEKITSSLTIQKTVLKLLRGN